MAWYRYINGLAPNWGSSDAEDGDSSDEEEAPPPSSTKFVIVRVVSQLAGYLAAGDTLFRGIMRARRHNLDINVAGIEEPAYHET